MKRVYLSEARLTLLLFVLIVCFLALALLLWLKTESEPVRVPLLPEFQLPALNGSEIGPDNLEMVLERPLFWAGRRPLAGQEVASPKVVETSSDGIKVLGTLLQGNTHFALLGVGDEVVRVSVGSELPGGWKVTSVKPGQVSMNNGSRVAEIEVARPRSDAVHLERLGN
ncbi:MULTISPECIES: hypothetical protein [unclassified Pseudomonas]|uniref:hypothetical protein n=1 Tax=unclassified Pseudomonas TaxID=196821 RepID=UPI002448D95F|nr:MULTISPECIES: hypothetical protein [unclassified Pseudomonas]MDG9926770.1 hypothetical protein [Pseudomonas sp. GD04042]MDH0482161.1 hypothetical protein [Pseudomonas sp. GD04015]MDH0603596.1 hypothetical protein [Pseudomonas sp. GD03869]